MNGVAFSLKPGCQPALCTASIRDKINEKGRTERITGELKKSPKTYSPWRDSAAQRARFFSIKLSKL